MSIPRLGKYLILFSLLVLPVGVFLFLKLFGTNYYDLPVFQREENVNDVIYFSKSEAEIEKEKADGSITIESFGWTNEKFAPKNALLFRVQDRYTGSKKIKIVSYDSLLEADKNVVFPIGFPDTLIWRFVHEDLKNRFSLPQIEVEEDQSRRTIPVESMFILRDEKLRIRGIFDARDEKEFDRLILEIEVLLYGRKK